MSNIPCFLSLAIPTTNGVKYGMLNNFNSTDPKLHI